MATKKQKRQAAQAKREKFMAEVRADGLKALKRDQERRAEIEEGYRRRRNEANDELLKHLSESTHGMPSPVEQAIQMGNAYRKASNEEAVKYSPDAEEILGQMGDSFYGKPPQMAPDNDEIDRAVKFAKALYIGSE